MAEEADDDWSDLHSQVFELWVEPELKRRKGLTRADVTRALVLMDPSGPRVLLNDEVQVIANVVATRAIEAGEPVTTEDYSEIRWARPADVDPDLGWLLYVALGDHAVLTFDLRANLGRAEVMLERADEFLTTAREALAKRHAGPAIDNALSAAELAVKAEVYLLGTPDKEGHHQRLDFWAKWVEQGNAPGHLAETFARLTDERGPARYADGPVGMDLGEIEVALAEVADMLAAVRGHTRRDVHDAAG